MITETISDATEQIRSGLANGVEKVKEFSGELKDRMDGVRNEVEHGVRRGKIVVEHAVNDAEHRIKKNPWTAVALSAAGGLVVGLASGWLLGYRRRG